MHKLDNQDQRNSLDRGQNETQGPHLKSLDQLRHINENVDLMRNRVNHLKTQLQKEKDNVKKHKNLTDQVVKQKIEIHKLNAIKNRSNQDQKISQQKAKNSSFREMHKNDMNNILKALYLVKLDDARQMKNLSMQNRRSLQKNNQTYINKAYQRKRSINEQSEIAKKKYIEYYKNKLNSVYIQSQKSLFEAELIAEEKQKQLNNLKEQELKLMEEINKIRTKQLQAKKQYVAALSLNPKEVANAIQEKNKQQKEYPRSKEKYNFDKDQDDIGMIQSRSDSIRYKNKEEFFTKDPRMSMLISSNIRMPRPKVDQNKFQIILKELKKLDNSHSQKDIAK